MIRYFLRTVRNKKIKEMNKFKVGSLVVVVNPTKDEIDFLKEKFDVYPDEVEQALDENEIPRVEIDDNMLMLYTKYIRGNKIETLMVVIGKDFLMTVSKHEPYLYNSSSSSLFQYPVSHQSLGLILLGACPSRFHSPFSC